MVVKHCEGFYMFTPPNQLNLHAVVSQQTNECIITLSFLALKHRQDYT